MKIEGHTLNESLLNAKSVVVDVGANRGNFSKRILESFGCRVDCYEPDAHAHRDLCGALKHPKARIFNKAVAGTAGKRTFYAAEPAGGGNSIVPNNREYVKNMAQARTYEVETVTLESALIDYDHVDLLKLDCEGAEIEIIEKTPIEVLKKIRQISIEFHDFCYQTITTADTDRCIRKLREAGFLAVFWPDHTDPDRDYYFYRPQSGHSKKPDETAAAEKPVIEVSHSEQSSQGAVEGTLVEKVVDPIPIMLIHKSNSFYIGYTIAQARRSNPHSTIHFIWDGPPISQPDSHIQQHQLNDYSEGARAFADVYIHMSTNSIESELFCFQRWFILRDFMAAHKLSRCFYMDSDVLLYGNITREQKNFEDAVFTLSLGTSPHSSFFNCVEILHHFCGYLMDLYAQKKGRHWDQIVAQGWWIQKNQLPGGMSDMTAFRLYKQNTLGWVGEVSDIINDATFDHNIHSAEPVGFEMKDGIKAIQWIDNMPYCRYLPSGKLIRFNSLHCQGAEAKAWMEKLFRF